MSGAEPIAVLGAISSVIAIIETSKKMYDAAKNSKGLHESFRKASDSIPIILSTLYQAKRVQEQAVRAHEESRDVGQKLGIEEESRAVMPIMNLCRANAEVLSGIFATIIPNKEMSRTRRYVNAIRNSMPSKKQTVQTLMRETMEGLQLLHTYHSFSTMTTIQRLQTATKQLRDKASVPDDHAHLLPRTQDSATITDDNSGVQPKRTVDGDLGPIQMPIEGPLLHEETPRNIWMNANGTKVMNQIGTQIVHSSQNFTI